MGNTSSHYTHRIMLICLHKRSVRRNIKMNYIQCHEPTLTYCLIGSPVVGALLAVRGAVGKTERQRTFILMSPRGGNGEDTVGVPLIWNSVLRTPPLGSASDRRVLDEQGLWKQEKDIPLYRNVTTLKSSLDVSYSRVRLGVWLSQCQSLNIILTLNSGLVRLI